MSRKEQVNGDIQLFPQKNGEISIWDHPNFKSSVVLPKDYKPLTRVEQGLEMILHGRLNEDQVRILKVIGDAICSNENQLRRYMSSLMTYTTTSKHLTYLRKYGLIERHKCRLAFNDEKSDEDIIRPPAPFTLGIAGYKLLSHLYSGDTFASSELWQGNHMAVQRYVAMNEIRCLAVETKNVSKWSWHPLIGGMSKYTKPFAAFSMRTPNGELQVILDRAQMSQNYVGYLKKRLNEYRYLYEKTQYISIDGFKKATIQVIAISVSSIKMAEFIQEEIGLHKFPFDVWFIVDEWFDERAGMSTAICSASKEGLRRLRINFFEKHVVD